MCNQIYINKFERDATVCRCLFTARLLYMFRDATVCRCFFTARLLYMFRDATVCRCFFTPRLLYMFRDATLRRCLFTTRLLYMFRVPIAPIIRGTSNCNCSFWYRSYHVSEQQTSANVPRWRKVVALTCDMTLPEAAVTVLCIPDDGCNRHPKHVE